MVKKTKKRTNPFTRVVTAKSEVSWMTRKISLLIAMKKIKKNVIATI